jgi:hypothetical protein
VPVLKTHKTHVVRIELAQTKLGLLADDRRWVIAFEAQPRDIGLGL